jgi:hypothetical protein
MQAVRPGLILEPECSAFRPGMTTNLHNFGYSGSLESITYPIF